MAKAFSLVVLLGALTSASALPKKTVPSPSAISSPAPAPAPSPSPRPNAAPPASASDLPASVDWRSRGAVTPVKNEGQCGSSWAFAATGALEGLHFVAEGSLSSYSEQQLVDCSRGNGNQGCDGGRPDFALDYTAANGIEPEAAYPYTARTGTCKYQKSEATFRNAPRSVDVLPHDEAALAAAVARQPVAAWIDGSSPALQRYTGGVVGASGCGNDANRAVLVVGYTPTYWIVKNSLGASWGSGGYVYIAKTGAAGAKGACGIAADASYPVKLQ